MPVNFWGNGKLEMEMGEWAYEFSTLPPETVSKIVKSQIQSLNSARVGAQIINHIQFGLILKYGRFSSGELSSTILKAFERRGFLLSDGINNFLNNEQISSLFKDKPEEKRIVVIKNLGNFIIFGATADAMMILAALTFGHAIYPGYPADPDDIQKNARKLESKSYQGQIGIAGSILDVGKLIGSVLKQSTNGIKSYADIFDFVNSDTSGLFKSKS